MILRKLGACTSWYTCLTLKKARRGDCKQYRFEILPQAKQINIDLAARHGGWFSAGRFPLMVELRNVTKRFGDFTAVTDINLTIQAGEFLTDRKSVV